MSRKQNKEIEFDEIFLDSQNALGFNRLSREGSVERPISKELFTALGWVFIIILFFFLARAGFLQIIKGEDFYSRSENNYLRVISKELPRGLVYDRFGEILVKNDFKDGSWRRVYPDFGFFHALGFLSRAEYGPEFSGFGNGASGLEAAYDDILRGKPAKQIEEINKNGEVLGGGILQKGMEGGGILTTLSKDLQIKLAETIFGTMKARVFKGGAGIFLDPKTGEVLALVSMPDFDPNILESGDKNLIKKYLADPSEPFFNRAIAGLYPPGSIVKLALAAGALSEGIISPDKKILSAGSITLPNPYDPSRPNVFLDWKPLGWVDMREAIAQSSDVYFYEIGGGYQDQKGLGPWNIKKYLSMFGLAERSGIDLPGEKEGHLPDPYEKQGGRDWTIGDTYHIAIGQGNMVITPIAAASYVAAVANFGDMPYPHLVRARADLSGNTLETFLYPFKKQGVVSKEFLKIVREGMRSAVIYGTAKGLGGLPLEIAAKTGTAEIGDTGKVNSWSIGFFPYEDPQIAFAVVMEAGPRENTIGATYVVSEVTRWAADTGFLSELKDDKLKSQ